MATNKRKDAAALFELIEKSTLKVPKGGNGALKIPSWWSSKVNPPTEPQHHEGESAVTASPEARSAPSAPQAPAGPEPKFPEPLTAQIDPFERLRHEHTAKPTPVDPTVKPPKESLPVDVPPTPGDQVAQAGQKEPNWDELPLPTPDEPDAQASAGASHEATANIPVSRSTSSVPRSTYGGSHSPSFSASSRASGSAYRPPVAVPPTTRLAAPSYTSSYASSRAGQNQNFIIMMLEAPLWVKVSFCAAIVVLISLVIALFSSPGKSQKQAQTPPQASAVETPRTATPTPSVIPDEQSQPPQRQGRVIPANQVQRRSDKYYLVLSSVRSQNIANDIAKFAAENGVDDMTVERHQDRGGDGRIYNNFKVISVEGVTKLDRDAEAMRMRIVEVGRKHPESKSFHKGIFDDAYFARVTRGK